MVVVTHKTNLAKEVVDEFIFMDEGAVVERGRLLEVFEQPKEKRVKRFLNLLK